MRKAMERYPTIPEEIKPMVKTGQSLTIPGENRCRSWRKAAPAMAGVERRKEKRVAASLW